MKPTYLLALAPFALAPFALALDLSSLTALKAPHSRQIVTKRGIAAGIDVAESNTVPVEDLATPLSSAIKVPSSAKSSQPSDLDDSYVVGLERSTTVAINTDSTLSSDDDDDSSSKSTNPFVMAISMIIVSEIGDKTFLISALMAMRHSRLLVFSASFASLAIMTVLSGLVGHALPTLLSQRVTQFLAAILFVIFGVKLTMEGLAMSRDLGVEEELAEVEEELTVSDMNYEMNDVESGRSTQRHSGSMSTRERIVNATLQVLKQLKSVSSLVLSPLWVQVFVMIFLGEWGDRSQIATIAMAAGSNYWLVIMGAVIGHGLCTAAAVVGGKMLASRISMRTVTLGGAFAFLVFAVLYFVEAMYGEDEA